MNKQPSGNVKRAQCSPLTEIDRLMVEEIAERWKTSESRVIGIALHEWLKNNFKSYESEILQSTFDRYMSTM